MNFEEVKELIGLINSSKLAYFEIKTKDGHIKMDKSLVRTKESERVSNDFNENEVIDNPKKSQSNNISVNVATEGSKINIEDDDQDLKVITSPMVGTFYGSPSPDSDSFITEGKDVKKGDTLCIIEAMKLMNEIESDVNGVIKKILVKDGDMVEYGQPLFKVKEN